MRASARPLSLAIAAMLTLYASAATAFVAFQGNNPQQVKLGLRSGEAAQNQTAAGASKPEVVLQAGITSPQIQVSFSPDGRLLASIGIYGNSIKLWEVASGRLLRQLDSNIPSMAATVNARPFRFSRDGRMVIALADRSIRRWDVDTGRELSATPLQGSKDFMAAFLSDDGSVLAATSLNNGEISVWATATGSQLRSIAFEERETMAAQDALALSPDGKLLAAFTKTVNASRKAVDATQQVVVFEAASGRKVHTLKVSSGPVQFGARDEEASLAFSADGAWLGLRGQTSMNIWDTQSGREVKSFSPPTMFSANPSDPNFVTLASRFVFSPDRRSISFVSEGRRISTVDASTGAALYTLAGHNGAIASVSFSSDGKRIATSSSDNQIKLWDALNGTEVMSLSGAAMPVQDIAFSSDGKSLIVAGQQAIESWELQTDGVRRTVSLPGDYAISRHQGIQERGVILSRDGRFAIAGSPTQPTAKIWEVASGRELPVVSLTQGKELQGAAFSPDGGAVALVETDKQTPRSQGTAQVPSAPSQPIVMPDMTKIMEQMRKDPKKMQDQMKKAQEAMKKGDLSAGISLLETMGVTAPGSAAGQTPNGIRILDVASGRQLQSIPTTATFFNQITANTIMSSSAVSFSPDGRVFASSAGFNSPITLRESATGRELRTLKAGFSMSMYGLAWSPDGKRLASAHWGIKRNLTDPNAAQDFSFDDITFEIKIWDTQSGNELNSLAGHNNFVNGLAFSRDGRLLASGSYDSTIKIWDLSTGQERRTLRGHTGSISAIEFSPDGRFIVSGSDDGSARLWNVSTGELLATLVNLNRGEDWLVVTPSGLFDGSPGGWNQILWRFSSSLFDVSPVEIFFNEYYHPGLLSDILAGKKIAAVDISQKDRRQPKLSIEVGSGQTPAGASRELNVRVSVTDAPAGAEDVRLFRNGLLVKVWRGDVLKGQPSATLETTVSIVAGPNRLTAYAFNRDNVKSSDASIAVNGADSLKRGATLHLVVMGVNEYSNSDYNLKYAAADARDFAEEVERQQRKLSGFSGIEMTSLLDRDATKANLLYALARIAGWSNLKAPEAAPPELLKIKAAEPEDAVVVYYAGHGTAQDQRFYLIPHDLGYKGTRADLDEAGLKTILSHSISDLELEKAFEGIDAGHLLMVIDACNSGQALEAEEKRRGPMNSKGLAQLAYEKGMYILTAAQSYQAAMEAEQLGHGYLTYALVEEGLKSGAADDEPKDGQVVVREWLDYATNRVPRMQEAKMNEGRGLKHQVAFVEGEDKVEDVDKRSLQRPRVFYRRELESQPLVVAKP